MKSARFEVYQDKKKGWRFRLIAANGRIIAQGEAHTREADAWRAVEVVKKTINKAISLRSRDSTGKTYQVSYEPVYVDI